MRIWIRWALAFAVGLPLLVVAKPATATTADTGLWAVDPQYTADDPSETSITAADVSSLRPAWTAPTATNQARPIVAGGRVFTYCQNAGMCAYDAGTGAPLWTGPGSLPLGVVGGVVYSTNNTAPAVYGTDAATGKLLWTFQPPGNHVDLVDPEPNGIFYVGTEPSGWLYAVSESTRKILWSYDVNPQYPNDVEGTAVPFSVALSGNTLFYVSMWTLDAFDATTGTLLWTGSFPNDYWGWRSVVVAGTTVLAPFYYPDTDSDHGGVAAFPVGGCGQPTCTPSWLSVLGGDRISGIAVKGSTGYAIGAIRSGNTPSMLVAFSLADGDIEWQTDDADEYAQMDYYSVPSAVSIAGDLLWYGTETGMIAAIPTDGCGAAICDRVWAAKLHGGWGEWQPTIANGVVYAAGDAGLTAFAVPGQPSAVNPSSPPDTTAPTLTVASVPVATTATTATFSWHATDSGSGVLNADVVYRKAAYNGTFSAWVHPTSWQYTTATSVRLALSPGFDYCVEVRARDRSGNVSKWSSPRCITRALDDRSLAATSAWYRGTASHYYFSTYSTTTRSGATLSLTGARTDRVGVLVIRCPRCGALGVYSGTTLLARINLTSSTRALQLVMLPRFSLRTTTIALRTLSASREVTVDGLAVAQT